MSGPVVSKSTVAMSHENREFVQGSFLPPQERNQQDLHDSKRPRCESGPDSGLCSDGSEVNV